MIERVRERSPNLRGLKVSDTPFSAVEPYLAIEGMDVFVGNEPLVLEGMERGAVGAVSGLASAFPAITAALVHERSARAHDQVMRLRAGSQGIPFHAAMKEVLVARDVLTSADVRAPLRGLHGRRASHGARPGPRRRRRLRVARLTLRDARDLGFAPAIPTWEMGIMIRTRTAGLVAAMMPCRLCCRTAPHGAPAAGTRAMRP